MCCSSLISHRLSSSPRRQNFARDEDLHRSCIRHRRNPQPPAHASCLLSLSAPSLKNVDVGMYHHWFACAYFPGRHSILHESVETVRKTLND